MAEALATVPGGRLVGTASTAFTDIQYDSREVTPGTLFVALRGTDFDGHTFIDQAIGRGATAVVVDERWNGGVEVGVPQLRVADTRAALAPISSAFFGHPSRDLPVVGITGTDGKTTTAYIVDHLLQSAGRTTGMAGTVAVRIAGVEDRHALRQTTQESVENQRLLRRMVGAGCDVAVLEATSHGLDLHRLDDIGFAVGAITNATHEHLEHHGTIAAYWRAKAGLFERVVAGGRSIVNLDDEGARSVLPYVSTSTLLGYSRMAAPGATLLAESVASDGTGSTFEMHWDGRAESVRLPLVGAFNVDNSLCAAGIALSLGLSLETVVDGLASAPAPPGRMVSIDEGQPFSVIVDYAHTPESLSKVLLLLRSLRPDGRLIVVFGSAGDRDPTKRPIQGDAAGRYADHVIVTSEDPRTEDPDAIIAEIAVGARRSGRREGVDLDLIPDRRDAIARALRIARAGDTILLAGKGHEGSIIVGHDKHPWDEEQVAREELLAAGFGDGRRGH
jgi:UDP-N-acetylmuramoyl-L-alanyl-D-glutamate--2,6-diaminopimelate ligase